MQTGILHLHSLLRWLVLALLIYTVIASFIGWTGNKPYTNGHKKLVTYTVLTVHVQLLLGLLLYFWNGWAGRLAEIGEVMSQSYNRFYSVEHTLGMLIAVILITIGSARSKRIATDEGKYKAVAIMFGIALLLILISIPWPFREVGAGRGWL